METAHGFDYNIEIFDETDALEFVLSHFAFMEIDRCSEETQHDFITQASNIVDRLKLAHEARANYHNFKFLEANLAKLALKALVFGMVGIVPGIYLIKWLHMSPHASWMWPMLIVMGGLFILLPVIMLARNVLIVPERTEKLLCDVHNIEMQITEDLYYAATVNTIDVVEMRHGLKTKLFDTIKPISLN